MGFITPIFRSIGTEPSPDDRVSVSKRLNLAPFEQMKLCKVESGQMCWIYPGNMHLPNVK